MIHFIHIKPNIVYKYYKMLDNIKMYVIFTKIYNKDYVNNTWNYDVIEYTVKNKLEYLYNPKIGWYQSKEDSLFYIEEVIDKSDIIFSIIENEIFL